MAPQEILESIAASEQNTDPGADAVQDLEEGLRCLGVSEVRRCNSLSVNEDCCRRCCS